jgi:hypothetical protein
MTLNEQDLRRIAAESMCDLRTVRKAYATDPGRYVRQSCLVRIVAAAARLGVELPACAVASSRSVAGEA